MSNEAYKVRVAWYELLNGNLSNDVQIFATDVPANYKGHYVQLRIESDSDQSNNQTKVKNPVIITDIVTQFDTLIDDSVAPGIDSEIDALLFPVDVAHHALPVQDDIQIVSVQRRDSQYLPEDDGAIPRINRLVTRNVHRVVKLINQS